MDDARGAADRSGEWRSWAFLTLQIQLAAERMNIGACHPVATRSQPAVAIEEDPICEWARAKAKIRTQLGEIPFMNWFDRTWQIDRCGTALTVAVPDEPTRSYLESEYHGLIESMVSDIGVAVVRLVVCGTGLPA
jgi:hypothetical protein